MVSQVGHHEKLAVLAAQTSDERPFWLQEEEGMESHGQILHVIAGIHCFDLTSVVSMTSPGGLQYDPEITAGTLTTVRAGVYRGGEEEGDRFAETTYRSMASVGQSSPSRSNVNSADFMTFSRGAGHRGHPVENHGPPEERRLTKQPTRQQKMGGDQ